jgi:hypothetical protein
VNTCLDFHFTYDDSKEDDDDDDDDDDGNQRDNLARNSRQGRIKGQTIQVAARGNEL